MNDDRDDPVHKTSASSVASRSAGVDAPRKRFFSQLGLRGRGGASDYIYDILIVVIGVFLGITFEGMASGWDRTHKAQAALIQLLSELERDQADMSRVVGAQRQQSRDLSEIEVWLAEAHAPQSVRIDSLLQVVVTSYTVYPRRGTYTSMIAAGQLALLPVDVSSGIVNLYENVYGRLAANGEHYDYSLERDFLPAYARSWDPARRGLITSDPADRIRFRNIIILMRTWSDYYVQLVADSQTELRSVLAYVKRSTHDAK